MSGNALSPDVLVLWRDYLESAGVENAPALYDVFHFDNNERDANELAALVLAGQKRATAALAWSFEFDGRRAPRPGDLSIVVRWNEAPQCVIETTAVTVCAYDEVDAAFAAREGEGDLSLAYWRRVHWKYFSEECARIGREPARDMPVVCEQFEVVYPKCS